MFTQCSKCETVFKLSAEVLRAAGGQVRCGKCGEVFNALARLAEDANTFATSETEFELETRADSILETPVPAPPGRTADAAEDSVPPPGVEIARLQILDWSEDELPPAAGPRRTQTPGERNDTPAQRPHDSAGEELFETSLEFTLPPGELDRIFVESKASAPRPAPQDLTVEFELDEPAAGEPAAGVPAAGAPAASVDEADSLDVIHARSMTGFEVPDEVRRDLMELDPAETLAAPSALAGRAFGFWLGMAIAAALLLSVQMVHHNREWLAAHAPFGGGLRALYGALGAPVPPPASLSAYQLRQWGVTGDPGADGTLRVRASILNTAAQLEPYPLLRVTLEDRFGGAVGTRDFEPGEYLGKPTAKLLAPGERVDATMDILDPGKSAEGFEIDVCLRAADRRVACANDAASKQ
ncbi:MAG TPA: DUF3426 domain-containing protein [Steroidobacteraceae bacterium]|jgi:predicted Zn finger-like uncharacterized protein